MPNRQIIKLVRPQVKRGAPPQLGPRRGLRPMRPGQSPPTTTAARTVAPKRPAAESSAEEAPEDVDLSGELAPSGAVGAEAVAALEAAAGQEEGEAAPVEVRSEEPSNFLSMYFRDMARLAVLRPQEEFDSARKIEGLEVALWVRILCFLPMTDHLLQVCEQMLDAQVPEFKELRKIVKAHRAKRASRERLERAVLKVAERVRTVDVDKRMLDVVLDELKKIYRGLPERMVSDALTFSPTSRPFREYLHEVARGYNQAHAAKNEFVKANLRLVVSIARRFK